MSAKQHQTRENKRRFWAEHIRQWKVSGLSQSGYCREHELKPGSMTYWKKMTKTKGRLRLVPIAVPNADPAAGDPATRGPADPEPTQETADSGLRIQIEGTTIKVAADFNSRTLRKLLTVLRGQS